MLSAPTICAASTNGNANFSGSVTSHSSSAPSALCPLHQVVEARLMPSETAAIWRNPS
jgi:hypothetical protein